MTETPDAAKEKVIYNCHTHIFTHENIPDDFCPARLVPIARVGPVRWALRGILKVAVPWRKKDMLNRYAAFVKQAYVKGQRKSFETLAGYYPEETKFVVLPMDMACMAAGKVKEDIDEQHDELAKLSRDPVFGHKVLPFAHVEPRRTGALDRLKPLVEDHDFRGVKIYPPLGYLPSHPTLMDEIYPYMIDNNLPLMAHCSPGVVFNHDMGRKKANALAHPDGYCEVMKQFPKLRVCLGHFGGSGEWKRHTDKPKDPKNPTWLTKIRELMKSGEYPNLYADISFTVFNFQENVPLLGLLLEDSDIRGRVLFGSDFFMVETQKYSERRLSTDLRFALGEDKFWLIANENPVKYLGRP
ncbi:MAG: amidohydrolase family protein [bacterium]|nr:amidohydrolase family protein [bacterium]